MVQASELRDGDTVLVRAKVLKVQGHAVRCLFSDIDTFWVEYSAVEAIKERVFEVGEIVALKKEDPHLQPRVRILFIDGGEAVCRFVDSAMNDYGMMVVALDELVRIG